MQNKNVLIFSKMYPNKNNPVYGTFVEKQVDSLKNSCNIKVIAPVPVFNFSILLKRKKYKKFYLNKNISKCEIRNGITVYHPHYIYFPGSARLIAINLLTLLSLMLSTILCIYRIKKNHKSNLVHIHQADDEVVIGAVINKLFKIPVVVTIHTGKLNSYLKNKIKKILFFYAIHKTKKIICVSEAVRNQIREEGINDKRLIVIYNGLNATQFKSSPTLSNQNGIKLLYVGWLIKSKGVHVLLKALHILVDKNINKFHLTLVGEGPDRPYFEELIKAFDLRELVSFAGQKSPDEIPYIMSACDMLVHPSFSESFGVVLIEAMACGKPIVATDCGGPREIVNEETGVIVPVNDAYALSEGILFVMNNFEKYDADRISSYVKRKFQCKIIIKQILKVYNEVIKDHKDNT